LVGKEIDRSVKEFYLSRVRARIYYFMNFIGKTGNPPPALAFSRKGTTKDNGTLQIKKLDIQDIRTPHDIALRILYTNLHG
ncbi:hypothetical protein ACJX0J_013366, partial [Zea mays]